ncbi:hypothetical protein SNC32_03825, partial [Escherichia coli]|nr:hypothetical protein [Escherichia coli]
EMMVVILTPVDGIIRWLPRGFSCSPNSEVNFYMGNLAHNNLDTGTTGHRVSFKCCDPVSLLILKDRKRIKA